jgi:UDP-glucose 4-epimerase
MRKVIVTGGAGYIGSHTVVELAKAGFAPVIVDDLRTSSRSALLGIGKLLGAIPSYHSVDCLDLERLHDVFRKEGEVHGVIHFAAFKAVGESVAEPLKYYDNNIASLLNVLQVMQWRGVKDLVFSSSCTVYGQPAKMPVDETAPDHDANSPYGYTKVVGERMIRDMGRSDDAFKAVLLRYFNPIGAHPEGHIGEQPNDAPSNLVPFITQTAAGLRERLVIHGSDYDTPDGTCMRDFVHVQDVARAHVMALEWMAGRTAPLCEAFNLGAGEGHSVKKVVDTFEEVSGVKVPHVYGPRRPGDIAAIWADTGKSRAVLGWSCEHDLRAALRDAWNWQRSLQGGMGSH